VCALLIGACGGSQTTSAGSTQTARATRSTPSTHAAPTSHAAVAGPAVRHCSSSQLRLSYVNTQGATGHLEATFALRDASARSCSLQGYPGAQLLDAAGRPLVTHLKRGGGFFPDTLTTPRRVLLTPGASAQFGLSFADNNEYVHGKPCPAASTLESIPPNARSPLRVALTGGGHPAFVPCGGQLVASPVYVG
jgi:hypothetical protein